MQQARHLAFNSPKALQRLFPKPTAMAGGGSPGVAGNNGLPWWYGGGRWAAGVLWWAAVCRGRYGGGLRAPWGWYSGGRQAAGAATVQGGRLLGRPTKTGPKVGTTGLKWLQIPPDRPQGASDRVQPLDSVAHRTTMDLLAGTVVIGMGIRKTCFTRFWAAAPPLPLPPQAPSTPPNLYTPIQDSRPPPPSLLHCAPPYSGPSHSRVSSKICSTSHSKALRQICASPHKTPPKSVNPELKRGKFAEAYEYLWRKWGQKRGRTAGPNCFLLPLRLV